MAIPADRNVVQKEKENKLKYRSLSIEIERTWNMKCKIIPVINGVAGIVTNVLRKYLETITGKQSLHSLQKTAILGTSHIIRKVLQCDTGSLNAGDCFWFERRSAREKRSATRHNNNNNNNNTIIILIIFSRRS